MIGFLKLLSDDANGTGMTARNPQVLSEGLTGSLGRLMRLLLGEVQCPKSTAGTISS
jgi:hypothetical protein